MTDSGFYFIMNTNIKDSERNVKLSELRLNENSC